MKNRLGKDALIQCHTQARNITNNLKFKVDFTLLALRAKNVVPGKFHVDDSSKGRYNIILGQYLLTELVLNLKISEHAIEANNGPFKGSTLYLTLPALRATNVLLVNCHVDDSAKGGYNMILVQDLLTELVLNLKFAEHVIKDDDGPFKGSTTPMVYFVICIFKYLNIEGNTIEE